MNDFLRGIGSVLNLFPSDRNITLLPRCSDADAIRSDWEKIGADIEWAVEKNNKQGEIHKSHERHTTK